MEPDSIGDGLQAIAGALQRLGNADASTPMGGLEALGLEIQRASERIAQALLSVAEAITSLKGDDDATI